MTPSYQAMAMLLAIGATAAGAFTPSRTDYILKPMPSSRAAPPMMAAAAVEEPDGSTVTVTTLDGFVIPFRKFNGRYTALLVPQAELDQVGLARVRKLVDEHDIVYETYKSLVGTEPEGEGLARILIVPTTCGGQGGGCAAPGWKGLEITSDVFTGYADYIHYVIHEMGHCFDRYHPSLFSGVDPAHAWTAFFDEFVKYQLGMSEFGLDGQGYFDYRLRKQFGPYETYPGASWGQCVRDNACDPVGIVDGVEMGTLAQGGAIQKIASLYGQAAMAPWLARVREVIAERGEFQTPEVKAEILVESLSRALGSNLACVFDQWQWPMSSALRSRLSAFPASPFCADADFDGFSRLRNDCDDAAAAVRPGAAESVNGKDDDCNGTVDDVRVNEDVEFPWDDQNPRSVPFPVRITGSHPNGGERDCFRITLPAAEHVQYTFSSKGSTFQGWAQTLEQGSTAEKHFGFVWPGDLSTWKLPLAAGNWTFCTSVDQNGGAYELVLGRGKNVPMSADLHPLTFTPAAGSASNANKYLLPVPPVPSGLAGLPNLTARYWVSGFGEVGNTPATSTVPFTWTAPAGSNPRASTFRVAYRSGNAPVHAWSQHQGLVGTVGWTSQDIGSPALPGSFATFGEQDLTVTASGADIWGGSDSFRFTWLPLPGNGEVVAKVHTLALSNAAVKGGIMIRENLVSNARNVFIGLQGNAQAAFQVRSTTGGTTTNAKRAAAAPLWVKLTRNGDAFAAFTSADGASWSQLGATVTLPMATTVHAGLAVTSHDNARTTSAGFSNATVRVYNALPSPYVTRDIGSVGITGEATHSAGTFTVKGAGADIWGASDAFRYVYFPVNGNVTFTARVAGLTNTNAWAKAGVMIRENLTTGSKNAFMAVTPTSGVTFQRRTTSSGSTVSTGAAGAAPRWLRISRSGSTFTGSVSTDGTTWTTIGSQSITMATNAYVGIAVTSHTSAAATTVTLTNVSAN